MRQPPDVVLVRPQGQVPVCSFQILKASDEITHERFSSQLETVALTLILDFFWSLFVDTHIKA